MLLFVLPVPGWDQVAHLVLLVPFFALLLTMVGLFFTGLSVMYNTRIQRARFLWDTVHTFFGDDEIQRAFSQVEWSKFSFDPHTVPTSFEERYLDRLLYTLDTIGYLCKTKTLPLEDVQQILGFRILVVMDNVEVQKYLAFLEQKYRAKGAPHGPHQDARWLAQALHRTPPEEMAA